MEELIVEQTNPCAEEQQALIDMLKKENAGLQARCKDVEKEACMLKNDLDALRKKHQAVLSDIRAKEDFTILQMVSEHAASRQAECDRWRHKQERIAAQRLLASRSHEKRCRRNAISLTVCIMVFAVALLLGLNGWIHSYIATFIITMALFKTGWEANNTARLFSGRE